MGQQIVQLFMSPRVLGVTAGVLILLGVIPGMPHAVFLVIGSGLAKCLAAAAAPETEPPSARPPANPHGRQRDQLGRPPARGLLGLGWATRLIALVDKNRQGDLLPRIGRAAQFAKEVGFCRRRCMRDNLGSPAAARVLLRGVVVGGAGFPACSGHQPGGISRR